MRARPVVVEELGNEMSQEVKEAGALNSALYLLYVYIYIGSLRLLFFSMLVSFIIIITGNINREPIVCQTS